MVCHGGYLAVGVIEGARLLCGGNFDLRFEAWLSWERVRGGTALRTALWPLAAEFILFHCSPPSGRFPGLGLRLASELHGWQDAMEGHPCCVQRVNALTLSGQWGAGGGGGGRSGSYR